MLPATTISYSTSSSPEKENVSSNRLGTPPPPPSRGVEKPEGPSTLQPTTENKACCLKIRHISSCCRNKRACSTDSCGKYHHHTLHEADAKGVLFHINSFEAKYFNKHDKKPKSCLLQIMKIKRLLIQKQLTLCGMVVVQSAA